MRPKRRLSAGTGSLIRESTLHRCIKRLDSLRAKERKRGREKTSTEKRRGTIHPLVLEDELKPRGFQPLYDDKERTVANTELYWF